MLFLFPKKCVFISEVCCVFFTVFRDLTTGPSPQTYEIVSNEPQSTVGSHQCNTELVQQAVTEYNSSLFFSLSFADFLLFSLTLILSRDVSHTSVNKDRKFKCLLFSLDNSHSSVYISIEM